MSHLELEPIVATEENARIVQRIVYEDFRRLPGIGQAEAISIADPNSDEAVQAQYERLDDNKSEYYAVDGVSSWLGIVKLADWLHRDESVFMSLGANLKLSGERHLGLVSANLDPQVMGLHVFARSDEAMNKLPQFTENMLKVAVEQAKKCGRATLKCSVDLLDYELRDALSSYRNIFPEGASEPKKGKIALGNTKRTYELREIAID